MFVIGPNPRGNQGVMTRKRNIEMLQIICEKVTELASQGRVLSNILVFFWAMEFQEKLLLRFTDLQLRPVSSNHMKMYCFMKQMYSEFFHLVSRAELKFIYLEELIGYKAYLFSNIYVICIEFFSVFIIAYLIQN